MKKLIIVVLLAVFAIACTKPEINTYEEYGTKKSQSVNSEGDSQDYELKGELDDIED